MLQSSKSSEKHGKFFPLVFIPSLRHLIFFFSVSLMLKNSLKMFDHQKNLVFTKNDEN